MMIDRKKRCSTVKGMMCVEGEKARLSLTGAIVILSICLVVLATIIANAIRDSKQSTVHIDNANVEYELNRFIENFEELIKLLQENKQQEHPADGSEYKNIDGSE